MINQGLDTFPNDRALKCVTWKAIFLTGSVCTGCASAIKPSPAVNEPLCHSEGDYGEGISWPVMQKGKAVSQNRCRELIQHTSWLLLEVISTLCQLAGTVASSLPSGRCREANLFLDYQLNSAEEILWIGEKPDRSFCLVASLIPAVESQCSGLFLKTGPFILSY